MGDSIARIYAYVFGRRIFYKWNSFLFRLSIGGLGILNYRSLRESGEKEFLQTHLRRQKPGSCVLDVGANQGMYSRTCLEINPDIRLYAIEPHPVTYGSLLKNLDGTGASAFNVAMGELPGSMELYDHANRDGSMHASLYEEVIESIHSSSAVAHAVSVTTVDQFMAEQGIENIALLKVDVEGHDLHVLRGARNAIEQNRIQAIHFEFNEMNVVSRVFLRDFIQVLDGYDLYRLLPSGRVSLKNYNPLRCELFAYQNIVAILRH